MNIAFFVKPKSTVSYLYEDHSLVRGLCRLRESGERALPVLSRQGKYLGTVSEGSFLWFLADRSLGKAAWQGGTVGDLLSRRESRAVSVTSTMQELLLRGMEQSFVPVVDDVGSFVGVVSSSEVIRYFVSGRSTEASLPLKIGKL